MNFFLQEGFTVIYHFRWSEAKRTYRKKTEQVRFATILVGIDFSIFWGGQLYIYIYIFILYIYTVHIYAERYSTWRLYDQRRRDFYNKSEIARVVLLGGTAIFHFFCPRLSSHNFRTASCDGSHYSVLSRTKHSWSNHVPVLSLKKPVICLSFALFLDCYRHFDQWICGFNFQLLCLLPYRPGWEFSPFLIPSTSYLARQNDGWNHDWLKPRRNNSFSIICGVYMYTYKYHNCISITCII